MKNKKGFTLIELLAVIVILGLIMSIAIPSITRYITQSRKKTLATSIGEYINALVTQVNDGEYRFSDGRYIYAVPIECIPLEKGGTDPFGEWIQSSDEYWAYVLVQYDPANFNYRYGFTFKDSAGYGMYPKTSTIMSSDGKEIKTDLFLSRPKTGLPNVMTGEENWNQSGFIVKEETRLKVLTATTEGKIGNGKTTCTLARKGSNYDSVSSKFNTDFGNMEANKESYKTETNHCSSFQECYGDNNGELEYDEYGGLILDNDNAVAIITSENAVTDITTEYSVHLTVKASTNQDPPATTYAATIVAVANKGAGNYISWIGLYKNYLHIYSFEANSQPNRNTTYTTTGFTSIYIGDYNNKTFNIQVTGIKGGKTKVYINGEMKKEFNSGNMGIKMEQVTIGDLRPYRNLKFTGTLYEIEIYNRIISTDEIKSNYEHSKEAWGIY
ncbi:MAG: type II secretion system protein [Bacilli bacterium]|nr:type II secretion system protein [Bacilli bacterium]